MSRDVAHSFMMNQTAFNQVIQQYTEFGFTRVQILQAWQLCKQNKNSFHDTLISITQNNSEESLQRSQIFRSSIQRKEEEELKRAIIVSLEKYININIRPQETLEDLELRTEAPVGLMNLGNTCYMNVLLQGLFSCDQLKAVMLQQQFQETIPRRLQELFAIMDSGKRKCASAHQLLEAISAQKSMFLRGEQNDFNELQTVLIEALPIPEQLFYGNCEESLTCEGQLISRTQGKFGAMNLDVRDQSLEKAIQKSQTILIDDYEGRKAEIHQKILQAPEILTFYINRIQYNQMAQKNNETFEFPQWFRLDQSQSSEQIEIERKLKSEILLSDGCEQAFDKVKDLVNWTNNSVDFLSQLGMQRKECIRKRESLRKQLERIEQSKQKQDNYELRAVLMHDGTANSGHYYCYVQCQRFWWKCNDRTVTQVEFKNLYKEALSKEKPSTNVAGLIYAKQYPYPICIREELLAYIENDVKAFYAQIDSLRVQQKKQNIIFRIAQPLRKRYTYQTLILSAIENYNRIEYFTNSPKLHRHMQLLSLMKPEEFDFLLQPDRWQHYANQILAELVDTSVISEYEQVLAQFSKGNRHFSSYEPFSEISDKNYGQVIQLFYKTIELNLDPNLSQQFTIVYQAVLLRGCFLADLLVQKRDQSVKNLIKLILDAQRGKYVTPLIKQQVQENLKETFNQMEISKQFTDIPPESKIYSPLITPALDIVNITPFLEGFNKVIHQLEPWINQVRIIETTKNIIDQRTRLGPESVLYFS